MTNIQIITTPQEMQRVFNEAFTHALDELKEIYLDKKIEEDQNFSIAELATYLKVSKPTIHAYKNQKIIPFYQAGRTVYFKKSEVDKAFSNSKQGRVSR